VAERIWHPLPRRIVVFRALKLGDMLCAVPAFRSLRAVFPEAQIVLVGLPWAAEFVDCYRSFFDGFREFPGYPGLPECEPEIERVQTFLKEMEAEEFDLCIQMHGSGGVTNGLIVRFGARQNAGFFESSKACPDPTMFLPYPDRGLELRRLLRLLEHLGIPSRGEHLEFPLRDDDIRQARLIRESYGLKPHGYACVHPGASVPERRWPPQLFADVASVLANQGLDIVLTGSAGERDLTRAVERAMPFSPINLAGRTALGPLAALLSSARILVCNDTGVSHLCDALGVPSVVISTGDNPERWAPVDRHLHRVLCRDSGVPVEEVVVASLDLLADESGRAA
jgi:ADP-heptose:LPS heptosyltransferase